MLQTFTSTSSRLPLLPVSRAIVNRRKIPKRATTTVSTGRRSFTARHSSRSFENFFRLMFTECTTGICPCGDSCSNKRFQKRRWAVGLEKFWTGTGKGFGVRCCKPIKAGTRRKAFSFLFLSICKALLSQALLFANIWAK